ncbi:MAG TPA: fibronectin type III domain-containing protein [Microbacterium sp.]|uniref:fibronectin type III domain-containing protein n=1 Tax=Microbacterium sp. TaxID=51671 RepID=UPI002F93B4F2
MAYAEGQLNGARDYRVGIDVWYSGVQDWAANRSRFDWNVRLRDQANWGSFTNATCEWWTSIGGVPYYGTFTIPSPIGFERIIASGSTWHDHDGSGYRPGFASNAYMKVPHSNIGEGGSGDAWVDAPRIPKRPSPPGTPTFSEVTPTSVRVAWGGSGDNGGAGIDGYLLRFWPNAAGTGPYIDHSIQNNTSRVVTGLTPGGAYRFRVYAHNGSVDNGGFSNPSADGLITLPAGFYVGKGNAFPPAPTTVGRGNAFIIPEMRIGKGGSFVQLG